MDDRTQPTQSSMNTFTLTEEALHSLMQQIEQTHEGMFSCEETYALLDEYVDLVHSSRDAEKLMPLVKAHLDACPGCQEEYEILINILEEEETD